MQVTDVRIRKINQEGKMKAIVSVTLNDAFVVHDVKVVEGQNGLFVAMPSKRMPDGEFKDIAHPISQESRAVIQEAVLRAYEEAEKNQDLVMGEEICPRPLCSGFRLAKK